MTSCRQLIESGPSASTMIEDAHAAAVQLSETIQSLGSGKLEYNVVPPIPGSIRYNVTSYNNDILLCITTNVLYHILYIISYNMAHII